MTENKSKLVLLAEKLIAQETLEGEEMEAIFNEGAPKAVTGATTESVPIPSVPIPVEPTSESQPVPELKPQKAPATPSLLPKQSPAASD